MTLQAGGRITRYQTELLPERWHRALDQLQPRAAEGGDAIVGAVGTAEDVTARRRPRRRCASGSAYRVLFEQASDPILIGADDGTILDLNASVPGAGLRARGAGRPEERRRRS